MPGKAAKVIISEKQQAILRELSRSRTCGQGVQQRATIVLRAFEKPLNEEIAVEVGLERHQVGVWRKRWQAAWGSLCVWEGAEPRRLREAILEIFADAPRPGAPAKITASQVTQITAVACEPPDDPERSNRPIVKWTLDELRDEVLRRQIVPAISRSHLGSLLQRAAVQPHRKKMWLNTTEKDPEKFQREAEAVCQTYLQAPVEAKRNGTRTICVDEATSLQAIERTAPDKPTQAGSPKKQEFEYICHGTTTPGPAHIKLDSVKGLR